MKGYEFHYHVRRRGVVPWKVLSHILAEAAAYLEAHPEYDAHWAVTKAAEQVGGPYSRLSFVAPVAFRDAFGQWGGDDDGVLMLCFAAACAATGDL